MQPISGNGSQLGAAWDGIDNAVALPKPLNNINIYDLTRAERKEMGIAELPGSLLEAMNELDNDSVIKDTLGTEVYEAFRRAKLEEWDEFRIRVTDWEIERYMESV